MEDFYAFVRSAWVVWMMLLFIGILFWTLRPANRDKFRRAADIPLSDGDRTVSGSSGVDGKGRG